MNTLYGYVIAGALLLAGLAGFVGYHYGSKHADTRAELAMAEHVALDEQAKLSATMEARTLELRLSTAQAAVSDAYEKGKQDAQAESERIVADLRAGTLQLRQRWQGCESARATVFAAPAGQFDAGTADREESASRIVRAAIEADEQIRGLQRLLIQEREMFNEPLETPSSRR